MRDPDRLTENQRKWLKCLVKLQKTLGAEPTLEEWSKAMGMEGKNHAQKISDKLERDGYLKIRRVFKRIVTPKGREWL